MTENLDTTPAAEDQAPEAADAPQTPEQTTEDHRDQPDEQTTERVGKASREAARYRRQLRETEDQLATAQTTVDTLRKQLAREAIAASGNGVSPDVYFSLGLDLADHLTDDGGVNLESVKNATREIAHTHGLNSLRPDPAQMAEPYTPQSGALLFSRDNL